MQGIVRRAAASWLCGWLAVAVPAAAEDLPVDLELVLAADVSLSMDLRELSLQRAGYVAAIQSPEVVAAIQSGYQGRIAVTFVEWAGVHLPPRPLPWHVIGSADEAQAFAAAIQARPLQRARRTSISGALMTASTLFDENGYAGFRQVIDVSGDGPNNQGAPVAKTRDAVVARGITINGLALMLDPLPADWYNIPDLDAYYDNCVVGGFAAFSLAIQSMTAFESALRRKLVTEIAGHAPPARVIRAATGYDCLIGEKRWQARMGSFD
ncbi:MAG: DUF1194 domain-containing protein [Pseudomonadota bacterium]